MPSGAAAQSASTQPDVSKLTLGEAEVVALGDALASSDGPDLIQFMALRRQDQPSPPSLHHAAPLAYRLGWLVSDTPAAPLTAVGALVGDSLREFVFWRQRGRTITCQGQLAALDPARMQGRRVLEIGCGFGCNLLTLTKHVDDLVGVDPIPVYLQVAPALFAIEGQPAPKLMLARGEDLPLPAASRDVVFMLGALQYMDIPKVIAECARVLAPGGDLIAINGYYTGYVRGVAREAARSSIRSTLVGARTAFADTPYFQVTGRRFRGGSGPSTAIPVYPTRSYFEKLLRRCGFEVRAETRTLGDELAMVARRL